MLCAGPDCEAVVLDRPHVTSVVLNFGTAADTLEAVASLGASTYRDHSIVVVDNGSPPPDRELLEQGLDGHVLLQTDENLGYAGGNNVGVRLALEDGADLVFIVNPDIRVEPDALELLVDAVLERPSAGILGPRVLHGGSDPTSIWFDGATVDLERGGATKHVGGGRHHVPGQDAGLVSTDYVVGSTMLVRSSVFRRLGLLPEEYFLYFEETDFNLRARAAGWDLLVVQAAVAHHHRQSVRHVPSPTYVYYFVRSRLLFAGRHAPDAVDAAWAELDETWVQPWRERVERRASHWVDTFDRLVEAARTDAAKGRTGRRDDVHTTPHPTER